MGMHATGDCCAIAPTPALNAATFRRLAMLCNGSLLLGSLTLFGS